MIQQVLSALCSCQGYAGHLITRLATCLQDVVYGLLNIKAMQLVGGGAQHFQQWFDFLGLIKDKQPTRIGAPFQMDFPGEQNTPAGMAAMNESIPACWDSAFKCSCGDCPDAPTCIPVCLACTCASCNLHLCCTVAIAINKSICRLRSAPPALFVLLAKLHLL